MHAVIFFRDRTSSLNVLVYIKDYKMSPKNALDAIKIIGSSNHQSKRRHEHQMTPWRVANKTFQVLETVKLKINITTAF